MVGLKDLPRQLLSNKSPSFVKVHHIEVQPFQILVSLSVMPCAVNTVLVAGKPLHSSAANCLIDCLVELVNMF